MNFFKFFSKKKITYLGRGGIKYRQGTKNFYIDTNNLLAKDLTIEIFRSDVKTEDGELLDEENGQRIAIEVKKLLEEDKVRVIITPPIPEN